MPATRPPSETGSGRERRAVIAAVLLALGAGVLSILWVNRGVFTFTLDDAYIHLRLAREIAHGHYGYNAGEAGSPASSVVYPFLLAPFVAAGIGPVAAFVFNAVPLLLIAVQLHRWIDDDLGAGPRRASILTAFVLCGYNLLGLAFAGMETLLQIWLCVFVCVGLWRIVSAGADPGRGFWVAAIAGPLVRYELLALTVAALVVWGVRARNVVRPAVALMLALLPLAAFSLFLSRHGLGPLPDSVLVKAGYLDPGLSSAPSQSFVQNFIGNAGTMPGVLLAALAVATQVGVARQPRLQAYGLVAGFLLLGQLGVGELGWWGRYEAWALVAQTCLALAAWAPFDWLPRQLPRTVVAAGVLCTGVMTSSYVKALVQTPLGARNVYAQHFQMGRIVQSVGARAVALNDVGAVGWTNPDVYVFDLGGLATHEVVAQRRCCGVTSAWYEQALADHRVELVLAYDAALAGEAPPSWTRLGYLVLEGKALKVGGREVAIYATGAADQSRLRRVLREIARDLPATARLAIS